MFPETSNFDLGIALPSPTLPTSSTVTTFVAPSNKFTTVSYTHLTLPTPPYV